MTTRTTTSTLTLVAISIVTACTPGDSADPSSTSSLQAPTQNFADGVNTFESRVGQLRFEYGYPTEETATTLYDELDFQRAVQVYLWSLPLVSMQAFHERLHEVDESLDGFELSICGPVESCRHQRRCGIRRQKLKELMID